MLIVQTIALMFYLYQKMDYSIYIYKFSVQGHGSLYSIREIVCGTTHQRQGRLSEILDYCTESVGVTPRLNCEWKSSVSIHPDLCYKRLILKCKFLHTAMGKVLY